MAWKTPPSAHKKQVRVDSDKMAKRVGLKILRILTIVSPVDTGRFKANWRVGIASPETRPTGKRDKGGGNTFNEGATKIKQAKRGTTLFISNNLPYARRLNEGWSQQAPANFVEQAIKKSVE